MPPILRKIQGFLMGRPPNYQEIFERVVASGLPSTKRHVRYLRDRGITAIISLTEFPLPKKLLDGTTIKYFHFPLEDHKPADPNTIREIVKTIQTLVKSGDKVLVHCLAGLGRTGMVLAAYLMMEEKIDWRASLERVRTLRPGSVEAGQEKTLEELEKRVKLGF
ncbi:MAG: dual specificity protein phosphatase family protein [Candidatus Caldarchaeum sp.]|nr:dual specificity protein phosphatase family protein [Candidatus Caldarchaeum sp.]